MKVIDIDGWNRKKAYLWFSKFSDPTYALSVKLDVTPLKTFLKESGGHFFDSLLYLAVRGLNAVPELRLRIKGEQIIEYDFPDPSFTVALGDGSFDICRAKWSQNAPEFLKNTRKLIKDTIASGGNKPFGDSGVDVYYVTCLPWLDFETMTNPIPDDPVFAAIPRVCWGKCQRAGERYLMPFALQVSHALVDGKPLSDAFAAVQECIDNCAELLI